jgi:uncharacterized protein YbjT (DUF2867 family)
MSYLITAATGNVGSRIVERLLRLGERPRVLVRDAHKASALWSDRVEVTVGDLGDAAAVAAAMRGVDRVFLANAGVELPARDHLAAVQARAAGVRHIVKLSTLDVQYGVGTGPWHAQGEAAIGDSGVGFTFVRPSGFMINALAWADPIRAYGRVQSSTGDGKIAFIHLDDIADVAVLALTRDLYVGRALSITGPVALSYAEMVAAIAAAIGRQIVFESISDAEERQRWSARGEPPVSIDYHLSIFSAIRGGRLAVVTGEVERLLGRAALSFDQWVRENAAAFRGV